MSVVLSAGGHHRLTCQGCTWAPRGAAAAGRGCAHPESQGQLLGSPQSPPEPGVAQVSSSTAWAPAAPLRVRLVRKHSPAAPVGWLILHPAQGEPTALSDGELSLERRKISSIQLRRGICDPEGCLELTELTASRNVQGSR